MQTLANCIWIITGGFFGALAWVVAGIFWHITIIGIPFGKQCFKLARLQLTPFGLRVVKIPSNPLGLMGNILWFLFTGWELFLINLLAALIMALTIIGIPFAVQALKIARLSLMPFGKEVL